MGLFGAAGQKPGKLSVEQIHKLVTNSRGKEEVREVLKKYGGRSTKAVVTAIVSCKNGRVQGSRWMVLGGAGKPDLKVKELTGGGEEDWKMKLNLTDLSIFKFNDIGAKANFSQWVEGKKLVEKMKAKGGEELTDQTEIEEKMKELRADFVGRLTVIPMGGNEISCCFTVAPTSLEGMRKICLDKTCLETSPRIPCKEVKISTGKGEKNPKTISFLPCEAGWKEGPSGWVLFPLLERIPVGTSTEVDKWPKSEDIRRELFKRLRTVFVPGSCVEVWKFYDRVGASGQLKYTQVKDFIRLFLH